MSIKPGVTYKPGYVDSLFASLELMPAATRAIFPPVIADIHDPVNAILGIDHMAALEQHVIGLRLQTTGQRQQDRDNTASELLGSPRRHCISI